MVCGSGTLASSPPIRAVRASSQASRAAGVCVVMPRGCAAGGCVEAQKWGGGGQRWVCRRRAAVGWDVSPDKIHDPK